MGEEADPVNGEADAYGGVRVLEWEIGLPTADDLMPLSQPLVPPKLASAFSIQPEPSRTILDVHRASQATLSSLLHAGSVGSSCSTEDQKNPNPNSDSNSPEDQSGRALKRPRLVWTPQLHKRFVEVVAHLGIKNAVPKTIMDLMNVEGLTRENVASHLQKYRLYLKRMSGLSNEGPSVSDPIFASTPVPENLMTAQLPPPPPPHAKHVPAQMSYVIPMLMYGYDGNYQPQHWFGGYGEQRDKDWASGSKFGHGSIPSYPHRLTPNDN